MLSPEGDKIWGTEHNTIDDDDDDDDEDEGGSNGLDAHHSFPGVPLFLFCVMMLVHHTITTYNKEYNIWNFTSVLCVFRSSFLITLAWVSNVSYSCWSPDQKPTIVNA